LHFQCLLLAVQAPVFYLFVSGHVHVITLVVTYESHSCKRTAKLQTPFSRSERARWQELPLYSVLHCHSQER